MYDIVVKSLRSLSHSPDEFLSIHRVSVASSIRKQLFVRLEERKHQQREHIFMVLKRVVMFCFIVVLTTQKVGSAASLRQSLTYKPLVYVRET